MALAGTTIWEVETGGSDTVNGGAFDPGQTLGMLADGAATSATGTAPVFSSASYNFVAGDAGAWLYVASGTNWIPGWYKIASVAANAATLNGTIGQAVLKGFSLSTVAGCATVASPTGATWAIDYSQQSAAQFAYTDLASVGSGLLVSSVAKPFGKQQVGNSLVITGGTNFNTGRYVIASVSVGLVATVVGPTNITSAAGVNGTGGQGGALASTGQAAAGFVNSNVMFIKAGTYTVTSASTNVAAGCVSLASTAMRMEGYGSVRTDMGTPPLIQASGISTFALIALAGNGIVQNLTLDGAALTSSRGLNCTGGTFLFCYKIAALNCTNNGFLTNSVQTFTLLCRATGCSTQPAFVVQHAFACEAYSNTVTGFAPGNSSVLSRCLAYNNSGASTDGFGPTAQTNLDNCSAYGNGRDGFRAAASGVAMLNCLSEANTGIGFNAAGFSTRLVNCAAFNNTGGNTSLTTTSADLNLGFITGTASFFVNPGSGNLALNNTAGGGAAVRAAGIPGTFLSGTTTGYLDLGAAQHQDTPATVLRRSFRMLPDEDMLADLVPVTRRNSVHVPAANTTYVFSRRVVLPPEEASTEMSRRASVIFSPVQAVFVRRTVDVRAELPWSSRRSVVVNSTVVNVFVKRGAALDSEEPVVQRRAGVFIPGNTTVVNNIFVRRMGNPEAEPSWFRPARSPVIYSPVLGPAATPVINRVNNQFFYEETINA